MKSMEKLTLATMLVIAISTTAAMPPTPSLSPVKFAGALLFTPGPAATLVAGGGGIPPRIGPESAPPLMAGGGGIPPLTNSNGPRIAPEPAPTLMAGGGGIPPLTNSNGPRIAPEPAPTLMAGGGGIPPVREAKRALTLA